MKKIILLFSITVVAFSCKKDDPATPVVTTGLKTGSTWVYKYTDYNEAGAVVSSSNITAVISGEQSLGGQQYWVLSGGGSPSFFRKGTDGYYDYQNGSSQLHYKFPAAVNDTWRFTYSSSAGDYNDYKVIAINENVTVPMGVVACFQVEGRDSNSLEDVSWYNEANVLVKQMEYDQTGAGVSFVDFTIELVSFTP